MREFNALNIGWMELHDRHLLATLDIPQKQVLLGIGGPWNDVFGVRGKPALQIGHMLQLSVLVGDGRGAERRIELAFELLDHCALESIHQKDGVLAST